MSAIGLGWLYVGWGAVLFETNYGLMQHSPFEIKERLLKALDKEYNVVDLATVLDVVTILEKTPITKEALEATRLGRDINELRRRTKNDSLAKRAKDLVRRWRDLILPQGETAPPPPTETSQQNGGASRTARSAIARAHPPISPAPSLPSSDKSNISPALSTVKVEAVPKTHAANKRLRKSATPPRKAGPPSGASSPDLPPAAKRVKTESQKKIAQRPLNGDHYDSVGSDCEIVSVVTPAQLKQQKNRKKAPKDRTHKDATDDIVKEKIASIARIPKVKTTQELLAGLKSRSGESPSNCALPVIDHDIAKNKTEHLARFLRSQGDELEEVVVDDSADNENGSDSEEQSTVAKEEPPAALRTAEEILARLPPLDLASINWDETPLPSPRSDHVSGSDVDRVLNDQVESMNGNMARPPDGSEVFREWHQVVTRTSYNSEPIHILPYVVID